MKEILNYILHIQSFSIVSVRKNKNKSSDISFLVVKKNESEINRLMLAIAVTRVRSRKIIAMDNERHLK